MKSLRLALGILMLLSLGSATAAMVPRMAIAELGSGTG